MGCRFESSGPDRGSFGQWCFCVGSGGGWPIFGSVFFYSIRSYSIRSSAFYSVLDPQKHFHEKEEQRDYERSHSAEAAFSTFSADA